MQKPEDFRMPQVFKAGSYWVYFWADEGRPLEPVHVHISEGSPTKDATKVWITKAHKCLLANNNSHINTIVLRKLIRIVEARAEEVEMRWNEFFGELRYYC